MLPPLTSNPPQSSGYPISSAIHRTVCASISVAAGDRIRLVGTLRDGDGLPVGDACVEIWQADPPAGDTFPGFGRCATDAAGNFTFVTLKPGPLPGRGNALQAPHIVIAD